MAQPTKPVVSSVWASTAPDNVTPTDAFIAAGWPQSTTPPSRGRFNWLLNYLYNGVRYFSRRGIADYDAAETYMTNDKTMGPDGLTYISLVDNNMAHTPASSPTQWARWGLAKSEKGIVSSTTNGSFVVPLGVTQGWLSSGGAGGGGGGGGGGGVSNFVGGGGGGGASGQCYLRAPVTLTPGSTVSWVLGTGGTGGNGGVSGGNNGTAGGNTVITGIVGGTITLNGGSAGSGGANATSNTAGGPGGTAAGDCSGGYGSDAVNGAGGGDGGTGGSSPFGGGGPYGPGRSTGGFAAQRAGGYCSGGGGGGGLWNGTGGSGTGGNGGAGTNGIFILEY